MKNIGIIFLFIFIVVGIFAFESSKDEKKNIFIPQKILEVPDTSSKQAKDFFAAAKKQIGVVKTYDFSNGYYGNGGFPPEDTGVCSDVIWRAYEVVGENFKKEILDHGKTHKQLYTNFGDNNIAFRRVANIDIFLKNTRENLVTEMIPGNKENLQQWQIGDIVIFARMKSGLMHIGIISDKRRADGVPYMIDNHGYGTDIRITPLDWSTKIVGHYRVF